jgi:hypothetical protein
MVYLARNSGAINSIKEKLKSAFLNILVARSSLPEEELVTRIKTISERDAYRNESDTLQIVDLNIENRLDRVSFYGSSLDFMLDTDGLSYVRQLRGMRIMNDILYLISDIDWIFLKDVDIKLIIFQN